MATTTAGEYYDDKLESMSELPSGRGEFRDFILRTFNLTVFNYNRIKDVEQRLGMCPCSGGHEAVVKKKVWDSQGNFSHYTQRDQGAAKYRDLKRKSSKKRKKKKKPTKHR